MDKPTSSLFLMERCVNSVSTGSENGCSQSGLSHPRRKQLTSCRLMFHSGLFELRKHMRNRKNIEHLGSNFQSLNAFSSVIGNMTQVLGLLALLICLAVAGYLLYLAAPAIQSIPHDVSPAKAIAAFIAIDGMLFAPFITGMGITIWWKSRSN